MIFWIFNFVGFGDTIIETGEDLAHNSGSVDEGEAVDIARVIAYIGVRR
jgi:hypothetical protein